MKRDKTHKGFDILYFEDSTNVKCTIQESSASREEKMIWLGADDIGLKHFIAGEGWHDVKLTETVKEHYVANNRMLLAQSKVKELLPVLEKFAETGEI